MKISLLKKLVTQPLAFRPQKINPKKIGVILSDGSINFVDQKTAVEYGINHCQKSLVAKEPFERAVGIKKSRVVFQIDGEDGFVPLHNATEIMIHSHPDTYAKGCTTALSQGDYSYFIDKPCMRKIYAVNSNGEYYAMTKIPGFDFSKIDADKTFSEFNICANRTLFGHRGVPADQRDLLERCIRNRDIDTFYGEFYERYLKEIFIGMRNVPKMVVDKTHEFWVKFGERFGVRIKTNFSNFTNS